MFSSFMFMIALIFINTLPFSFFPSLENKNREKMKLLGVGGLVN